MFYQTGRFAGTLRGARGQAKILWHVKGDVILEGEFFNSCLKMKAVSAGQETANHPWLLPALPTLFN